MRLAMIVVLVLLNGCTAYTYPHSIDGLRAEGYTHGEGGYTTVTGEFRKQENYEVWSKEISDDGRRVHVCMVPRWPGGGYVWRATVSIDGREAWTYDSGTGSSQPALRSGISCMTSDPLPDGRLSLSTLMVIYH